MFLDLIARVNMAQSQWLVVCVVLGNILTCLAFQVSGPGSCSLLDSVSKILNITETISNELDATQFAENVPLRREYDFVIIGSGPSGCVLANRLSEQGNYSVLLLEAGSAEIPMLTNIPMSASNLQLTDYNWNYATEPQQNACLCKYFISHRLPIYHVGFVYRPISNACVNAISAMQDKRCNWPHGRGLGGSSIINYMIYTRGNRRDFDKWAAAGNIGWDYDSILPFFQKFEKSIVAPIDDTDTFGKSGLLQIEDARFR